MASATHRTCLLQLLRMPRPAAAACKRSQNSCIMNIAHQHLFLAELSDASERTESRTMPQASFGRADFLRENPVTLKCILHQRRSL